MLVLTLRLMPGSPHIVRILPSKTVQKGEIPKKNIYRTVYLVGPQRWGSLYLGIWDGLKEEEMLDRDW